MHKVYLNKKHNDNINNVARSLGATVGPGTFRGNPNTWMGTDDWFYYEEEPELEEDELIDDDDEDFETQYVFVFRRDTDATMFGLKWA
jgi:hypothetical protein